MSKLNVDQKTIRQLFDDKKADFLIPDYQRPYAWTEEECQTLWDDIFQFAFPNNNSENFNNDEEYYLGTIVVFNNKNNKLEIIDGQQRITTILLLLRAFYKKFEDSKMQDSNSKLTKDNIGKCIWKTDEFGTINKDCLKIDSEVATDDDKGEFINILKNGEFSDKKNNYINNYVFFQKKIDEFLNQFPSYFPYLPTRILNNCILLPIEAESQDTALRIFSTLNDRGLPLSDSDIFKAQMYKFYPSQNKKNEFVEQWKVLEKSSKETFKLQVNEAMDELFTRYMYYKRAVKDGQKSKNSTTESLRKFYEKNNYELITNNNILSDLKILSDFWKDILDFENNRFNENIKKKIFVLKYSHNGMWTYFLSVYFIHHYKNNTLNNKDLEIFLDKITVYIIAYNLINPGVNALRTPIYAEMLNIVNNKEVLFSENLIEKDILSKSFDNFIFSNVKPITKSILTWWTFYNKNQKLLSFNTKFDVEHIFAKTRQEKEKILSDNKLLELLGNKSLLEKNINISVSDYKFDDKKRNYLGYQRNNKYIKGTEIQELIELSARQDFTENDILERNNLIKNTLISTLEKYNLLK